MARIISTYQPTCAYWSLTLGLDFLGISFFVLEIITQYLTALLTKSRLVQTLDNQISRQYLRIDTIFPESQLKKDMFFPDRLVERSIIFQTTETITHPFSHGTFQSHGYGFTSHLFHVVVKNRAKRNVKTSERQTFNKHWIHRTFLILNKIQGCIIFSSNFQTFSRQNF